MQWWRLYAVSAIFKTTINQIPCRGKAAYKIMIHLHRAKFKQKEGQPKKADMFYTTIVIPGEVLYTSQRVKNRVDALKTPRAAAKFFGIPWNGRYMDHTYKGEPVEKVAK